MANCKTTPLYNNHRALGGKLIEFAGWMLPVEYGAEIRGTNTDEKKGGLISEHLAVRRDIGVFDVSHMGQLLLSGDDALANLNYLTCNDVSKVAVGRAQYTALLNAEGGVIDDLIIYRLDQNEFMLCVNASNTEIAFSWIKDHLTGDVSVVDSSREFGLLALQGRKVRELMTKIGAEFKSRKAISDLKPFDVMRVLWPVGDREVSLIVAATGYTGEDGFEFFVPWSDTPLLWDYFVNVCQVVPIGLGARDTLRLEAGYPLHGHELDQNHSALESGLGWIVKFNKGDFIGREALLSTKDNLLRHLIPFRLKETGIARHGDHVLDELGEVVGVVTSGTRSPLLGQAIGLARVLCSVGAGGATFAAGAPLTVLIRGRRVLGEITRLPFFLKDQ
jgi:aminomethyltransferase